MDNERKQAIRPKTISLSGISLTILTSQHAGRVEVLVEIHRGTGLLDFAANVSDGFETGVFFPHLHQQHINLH